MTYSIVARDATTGQLGVAVQSHYFSVGSVVGWAQPGVGVVATQALVEISYGPRGLERMRLGDTAPEALAALVAGDDGRALRQVAMVDAAGRVATHTGERCIAEAGHVVGDGWSVQANMMRDSGVPEAMAAAFAVAEGDLTARLLAALDAAEAAGGDIRGRQSAALVVVAAEGEPWERLFDVRVDDHGDPLAELRRLVDVRRAYLGDQVAEAASMLNNPELAFWRGVALVGEGKPDEARAAVYRLGPEWLELMERLDAVDLLPGSEEGSAE